MPTPGLAAYRYYNSNLQAPNIKCKSMTMDSFTVNQWQPSGICTYNGYKEMATSHTWTSAEIPCLTDTEAAGELTLYIRNTGTHVASVILAVVTKSSNAFLFSSYYQILGNVGNVSFSNPTSDTIMVTFDTLVEVRWIFRGF